MNIRYKAIKSQHAVQQLLPFGEVRWDFYYNPLSRLIQTDFPDDTTARVEFDVWQQKNYDPNDCDTSSTHYNTPQVIDLDVLGRAFQINDDNGNTTTHEFYTTHNQLDITGRIVQVTDALERIMTVNVYALSEKHQLKVQNIDSATRWMLNDTLGNPRYVWDSRDHRIKTLYDALLRPTQMLLKTGNNPEITTQQIIYGTSAALNNIGQIIEIDAQDGKTNFAYDFKGNVSGQIKQFAEDYQNELDWNGTIALNNEIFATQTTYDALNRPVTITQPDSTIITNVYAKGGLLQKVLHGNTQHITDITYNARGQREDIYYGNNTKTKYYYNPLNFRITRILTTRNNGQDILQDLNYTYDSVGNITKIEDNAQQTFYFNNQVVAPTGTYQYDALYRLIQATGRELTALQMPIHEDFPNSLPCPNTAGNAMQNYTHNYQYDKLGNMLQMQSVGNWTRDYVYNNPMTNNYLLGHGSGTVYTYDAHGNTLTMPHLTSMAWDYKDELVSVENGSFTSFYNYDFEGNRTRKVVVKNNIREERYYIGGYEVYRKYLNNNLDLERKTINVYDVKLFDKNNDDNEDKENKSYSIDKNKKFAIVDIKTVENGTTLPNPSTIIRYQYDNHLGSACLELDELGAIISYEEYHPFGTTSYRSGRSETEVSLKLYKYCGKERDEETGLYYYGARYYTGWIGRWISTDPLKEKYLNLTPYNYCLNNPIILTDPDGRRPDPPFGIRLGFNLGLGSNGLNFNVTASVGVEHRTPNFQAVAFASASVYGGQQLGTSSMTRGFQFDVTAGAYVTIGKGIGSPHNFYTLNYNTASPFNNTFKKSFTYGQVRTYNSAINAYGDGPRWQTQGIIGIRLGENFSVSTNNDTKLYGTGCTNYLLGDNTTDAGWTGGIVLNMGGIEMGYQNFSGYWAEFPSRRIYGDQYSAENREAGNGAYHQSLNRAFNFVRKGNVTGGVFSGAWFQNLIHKITNDGTYIYNNQGNVNITVGQ